MSISELVSIKSQHLIGDNNFTAQHRFLNIAILSGIVFYSFFLLINIYFEIDLFLGYIKVFGIVTSVIFFYYSRFKNAFYWPKVGYFICLIVSYFFIGLKNGGVTGGIAPIYTAILALMLFISNGRTLVVLVILWVLSISALFLIEFFEPSAIQG